MPREMEYSVLEKFHEALYSCRSFRGGPFTPMAVRDAAVARYRAQYEAERIAARRAHPSFGICAYCRRENTRWPGR